MRQNHMKNIILTGASSGIGMAFARRAANSGRILLLGRNEKALKELLKELPGDHAMMRCDVTSLSDCEKAVNHAMKEFGSVDVLVNNAGLGYFDPLAEGKLAEWHHMVDVNVKGILSMLHLCLPSLIEKKGHVINIGSVASHHVFPNSGVYCATKHAVLAISESIRVELMGKVRVTTISPGAVNTDFINKTTNETIHADMKDYFATSMAPDTIAQQIMHALNAPADSVINEILIRPFR
jgi:NADP-dependent 3-hydroxy acid dehydrogenase YdfG